jgi:anti-anti-sigma factor
MWCCQETINPTRAIEQPKGTVFSGHRGPAVVHVQDPLRVPTDAELRHGVRTLLCRGERSIVLDLGRVSAIDAAGVGQLVRAFNLTRAMNGTLRIKHAGPRVRQMLVRAGLFDRLSAPPGRQPQAAAS